MHWPSPCQAYYAQWILQYHHPRQAPWKKVAQQWLDNTHIHQGCILAKVSQRHKDHKIPATATYFKHCWFTFHKLNITQDTKILDTSVQAEPLWFNHRFHIPATQHDVETWQKHLDVTHVLSLLDSRKQPFFSTDQWTAFMLRDVPRIIRTTPAYHEWEERQLQILQLIRTNVPPQILAATSMSPHPTRSNYTHSLQNQKTPTPKHTYNTSPQTTVTTSRNSG